MTKFYQTSVSIATPILTHTQIYRAVEIYTLWLFNIAMENGPFIDGLPGFTY